MTTPDVPLRLAFSVEVPGSADQVWAAIATGDGISSWFLPTDVEGREGGAIVTHMGETDSPGTVTGWDPPHRFAYEEPEWTVLAGHEDAVASPLATEMLIEARSGGTCVVRVVSSAFGTGAEWENEFFESMGRFWRPYFDLLRMYLSRFPGQRAATLEVNADLAGSVESVRSAMHRVLGVTGVGQRVGAAGLAGTVERIDDISLQVSVDEPVPGYLSLVAFDKEEGVSTAVVTGWLFGEGAAEVVEARTPAWRDWLKGLPVDEATPAR